MREIKEIDLNQNVKIDITLKELDVIRVCLAVANDYEIASVFESVIDTGIKVNHTKNIH